MPIPPTFLFCLEREHYHRFDYLQMLGVELGRVLHGEQSFIYHKQVYAGETVVFEPRIADIYDKKDGALEFIALETKSGRQAGCAGGGVAQPDCLAQTRELAYLS